MRILTPRPATEPTPAPAPVPTTRSDSPQGIHRMRLRTNGW